jgi:hypothetical protein
MSDIDAQLNQLRRELHSIQELQSLRKEISDRMDDELTAQIRLQDARNRHARAYERVLVEFGAKTAGAWYVALYGPRPRMKS